jgi:catechol 2,3-dioxygenase-like lactoylglutathione lyase family enzyme
MRTTGIDHLVLRSTDVERTVAWYREHLGVEAERLAEWRTGEVLFPSLRLSDTTIIDVLAGERSGTNVDHFAVVVEDVDLVELASSGELDVVAGPADLWGARGQGRGLYVHDPDGNVVELRSYR